MDVNGSINTNSNLCLNGNCKSAWLDTNGNSFNGLNVGDLGAVYGNNFEKNLFAFNAPSSYEVFNGSSWNAQSVPTSLFSDNAAHNWGG